MMDIYNQRSRWKIYLALAGVCILFISLYYTNYLAQRLREGERNKALLLFDAYNAIINSTDTESQDLEADLTLPTNIILANTDIPIMMVANNRVQYGRNFGIGLDSNMVFLQERLVVLKKKGPEPIAVSGEDQLLYYQNSQTLDLLTYFPYVQLLLLAAFVSVGYFSINNARRAEQNRVWVGMAKETAHQLGTPISAIIGWIEHLRESHYHRPEELEVLDEMQNDVARLDLIADRFSKIGSAPLLDPVDVYAQMREITNYIRRRASRKIVFKEPAEDTTPLMVNINPHLFNWVVENIMRNALDAMDEGTGTIKWEVHDHAHDIEINISDTGKGIPPSKLKTIFEPGFTTKDRGWGLGLSLAQRIIENYHKGRIYVKHSKLGEGTEFAIHLPKKQRA